MKNIEDSIIIDAHNDLLTDVAIQREFGRKKIIETDYLPGLKKGNVDLLILSLYVKDAYVPEIALRSVLNQIGCLYAEFEESPDKFMLCKSYRDITQAKSDGKVGFILSFEGVDPLYSDLGLLKVFYELGVRIVGLTWSRRNFAADGCHYSSVREGQQGGLTDFGVQLVEKAEELGMLIDVSHINDAGFWDVMKFAKKPVIASHSNCRAITETPRNLDDRQIIAIAEKNGVIGINASSLLASDDDAAATVETLVDHMDHIIGLAGFEHLGLGFDLCDNIMRYGYGSYIVNMGRKPFDILKGHGELGKLIDAMVKRGYKDNNIRLAIGENFLRVLKNIN